METPVNQQIYHSAFAKLVSASVEQILISVLIRNVPKLAENKNCYLTNIGP